MTLRDLVKRWSTMSEWSGSPAEPDRTHAADRREHAHTQNRSPVNTRRLRLSRSRDDLGA